jgi:hypothetical protein
VANSGGMGPKGGNGGAKRAGGSSSGSSGSSSTGGAGKGGSSGGSGGGNVSGGASSSGGGAGKKKLDKAGREEARKKVRTSLKRMMARRTTNPNYGRYVSSIRTNMQRLYRSYTSKMMLSRRKMASISDKGNADWTAAYKSYAYNARRLKKWYSWWGMYLIRRRRGYKPCTKKYKKCKMWKRLSAQIRVNMARYKTFQKVLLKRLETWSKQAKGKEGKRIKKSVKRAKRTMKQQARCRIPEFQPVRPLDFDSQPLVSEAWSVSLRSNRYRKTRRNVRRSRKYKRGGKRCKAVKILKTPWTLQHAPCVLDLPNCKP